MKKFFLAAVMATMMSSTAFAGTIGVSMANSDTFLTVLRKGIEKSAADANQPVQIEIADDDVAKQLSQIQNFIAAKVDAIIVNAVDTTATAPMTKPELVAAICLEWDFRPTGRAKSMIGHSLS